MRKVCLRTFFIATVTSETLKKENQKKIDKQKGYVQLNILFLWNQKSQEADIQDYEIS